MPQTRPPQTYSPCKAGAELDELFNAVYDRLKTLASRQLALGARGTLDTTALVHELYLRLNSNRELAFEQPGQFFVYAARAMRHLLADRARDRMRHKAGGAWVKVSLSVHPQDALAIESAEQALALDQALSLLERDEPRAAQVVELRYFTGVSADQVAELLGIARRTADRDWQYACAFLRSQLE